MKFSYIQQFLFLGLLIATSGIFIYMLGEYLVSVMWAVVIAVVFYPTYQYLNKKFSGRSSIAAISTVFTVVLVVLIPLVFIGGMVVSESLGLYQNLTENESSFDSSSLFARVTKVTSYLEPYGISQDVVENQLRQWTASLSQVVASSLVSFSQVTITFLIHASIMLYLLFFFLRDGEKLQKLVRHHLPLGDDYERRLMDRFSETTQAVVKGTLAISAIQGLIGGTLFWAVGISSPVLWGVSMGVFALIPLLGTATVWLPAGIILIVTGSVWAGGVVLLVGALIISLIDQVLRPILVGRGSNMPDAFVLMAMVGGLATFGVSGFIIGPIIAALFLSLWILFEEKYRKELIKS
jgi:predicted PurR-regulated permease PerM